MTWLVAGNVAVKPLWFVFTTAVCIRTLGPVEYGHFVGALALAMMVSAFSDWGLSDYAVGETARRGGHSGDLFSTLTAVRLALALVAVAATLVVGVAMGRRDGALSALMAAAAYTGAFRALDYVRSFYRARQVMRYEAVSVVTERLGTVACGVVGLILAPTAAGGLAGMAVGASLALGANLLWTHRHLIAFERHAVTRAGVREALVRAFPLGVYGFLSVVFLNAGMVLLEESGGPAATAQFGAAYRFVEVAALLPAVVVGALYPRLSQLHAEGNPAYWRVLVQTAVTGTASATVIAAGLAVFGERLVRVVAGDGLAGAEAVVGLLAWQIPLMTLSSILGAAVMARGRSRILVSALVVVVPVNLTLNVLLIPTLRHAGPAWALLVGQILAVVFFLGWLAVQPDRPRVLSTR